MNMTLLTKLPPELRRGAKFVCWRSQEIRSGEWVRIPVDPHTGEQAEIDNPATWATFNESSTYYAAHQSALLGVGRVLATSDVPPLMAITFSGCIDERGHLRHDHPAAKWVSRFDTYTETTSDATGATLWLYATHDLGGRTVRTQQLGDGSVISIYRCGQFLPLTGQRLIRYSDIVQHRQPEVNALHQALFSAEDQERLPSPPRWRRTFAKAPPVSPPPPVPRAQTPRTSTPGVRQIDAAKEFLRVVLRNGAVPQARLAAAAEDRGISAITLRRAKKLLQVRSTRRKFQGKSLWVLPLY